MSHERLFSVLQKPAMTTARVGHTSVHYNAITPQSMSNKRSLGLWLVVSDCFEAQVHLPSQNNSE